MKVYSQLSSRRSQHLYFEALQRQQIENDPHFNIVSKTLNKKWITPILYELVHLSAMSLASVETDFAIDSSGFRCSTFGNYCEEKYGSKRKRNWLKVHICTGVNTNIVADVIVTDEHSADSPQLKKLVKHISKNFTINEISADMAYSSKNNLRLIDNFGGKPFIPFKKNATGNRGGALWRKIFHYFQLYKDEFLEHYHKRSNVESTFSAIKKKFGESVKSKNRIAQENELLCKIIAYNITVLIHEMIQLNGTTELLSFNGLQREEVLISALIRSIRTEELDVPTTQLVLGTLASHLGRISSELEQICKTYPRELHAKYSQQILEKYSFRLICLKQKLVLLLT